MLLLAFIASSGTVSPQAQATVRIVQAQRLTSADWQRTSRRREIVVQERERKVTIRLIELE